jgi:hypothetical protein
MNPKVRSFALSLSILFLLAAPLRSVAGEFIGSPSSAAAPMTQPVLISGAPTVQALGGPPPAPITPSSITPIQEVNYLDLLFKDGYAIPYHLKHGNFYDVTFNWGGSSLALLRWNWDDDNTEALADTTRKIQRWILYAYFNARYGQHLSYHLRLRNRYHFQDFDPINNSNEGLDVDQQYGELDFEPFIFTMGRQFQQLGRGHVLRTNFDAIKLAYSDDFVDVDMFTGKLFGSNQDVFLPYSRQQKKVTGVNVTYKEFKKHLFQGYVAGVKDTSDDGLATRDSHYEPVYFGLYGVGRFDIGKHHVNNIGYYGEMIRVTGTSNVSDESGTAHLFDHEGIDAYLLDFGTVLRFDHPWRVEMENEIMLASGDNTVQFPNGRVNSTRRGNPAGSKDSNFRDIAGFVNYGAALNPREANLIIYKLAFEAQPLRRLKLGLDYYRYWKVKSQGVISDIQAAEADRDVGHELDFTLQYNINRYTRLDAVYGHFFPGDAFVPGTDDGEDLLQFIISYVF